MSTDDREKLPTTSSKRKPRTKKPLCTFPECGPVNALKAYVKKLAEETAVLKQEIADRDARLEEMEAKIRNLQGDLFAPSSERLYLASKDGVVVDKDADAYDSGITQQGDGLRKRGAQPGHTGRGRNIPDSFPIIEMIHEIPLNKKVCPQCGKQYRDLNLTEDSIEIDYEVKVIVKKHRRKKAAKTCDCSVPAIMTAAKSPQIIPKGKFSTAFLCFIMVQKYFFQIPLNRQIQQWAMEGLEVNAGTIIGAFKALMEYIIPLYDLLVAVSREQKHWHVDETRWLVFVETPGKTSFRWWLWVFASKQTTVFVLDPSRSSQVPKGHFGQDAQGVINVDRYSAYKTLEGQLQRQLCWYHVRRDFIRAKEGNSALTDWADDWISEIHWLDSLNDDRVACRNDAILLAERQVSVENHLAKMADQRDTQLAIIDLKPVQVKVLRSLERNWTALTVFVSDLDIPIHNNVAERALRSPTVGRKNYYGNHAKWSGDFAVMMMSILQTAAQHKLNVQAYLVYYLEACACLGKVPEDLESYLPWNLSEKTREALKLRRARR
ncbi:IS66 family transposase [Desulfosporosinus sp. BICA1-9]|uniref:IS66 family transposase n=2 Tax=Desulfosporosinus sp. BICA1-9 TaxID=1531958 RepID=UPI00054B7ACB|nr:IS66 family transposase [Desulfosporosinus sp. BICA1-9]KJS87660.1 MAG: hypothetical protein JL57_13445 [Desulfosporosinus sp. BICA1-9]